MSNAIVSTTTTLNTTANEVVVYQAADGSRFDGFDMLLNAWLHGKSPNTKGSYQRVAQQFLSFTGCDITKVGLVHIQQFMDSLEGKATATIKNYTMIIKSLLSFCKKLGLIEYNAGVLVQPETPKTARHDKTIDPVDLKMMFRFENNLRNKLILEVLYVTGMRVSELISRKWSDITEKTDGSASLYVFGKGRKERYVVIPASLYKQLKLLKGLPDAPLFTSRQGDRSPLTRQQVYNIVKSASQRIDNHSTTPHRMRHYHATHALTNGVPLPTLRDSLGHESIQTTSIYLDSCPKDCSSNYLGY
jgi:integrase/recombinase XerD